MVVVVRSSTIGSETPVGVEPTSTGLQPVAWPSGSSVEYPRQESNLISDLRTVVCLRHTPRMFPQSAATNSPCGNRTHPSSLRGWRPSPIDERAAKVRRAGVEPAQPEAGGLQPLRLANAQPTRPSSTGGTRTHRHSPRFELGRFAGLRTVPQMKRPGI